MDIPDGAELMDDLSAARWIEEAFSRWPEGNGFAVTDFVPVGFEAYARILHPIREGTARWSDLAHERGRRMHPGVRLESLIGGRGPEEASDWDDIVPLEELPEREAAELVKILRSTTATPDRVWFALWVGYGFSAPSPGVPLVRTLWSRSEPRSSGREYALFRGPLEALLGFRFESWWQPPNLWWPDDHAWCVATEVDGYDTFLGGAGRCIDAVVEGSELEAFRIDRDHRFGPTDPLNPAPWDPPRSESDLGGGL